MRRGAGNCCLLLGPPDERVELVEQLRGHRRRDEALALHDGADGVGDLLDGDLLQQVAVGARLDRLVEVLLLVAHREHEDLRRRALPSRIGLGRLDAADPRHPDVHEHDVGSELLGLADGVLAVLGLGDDLDAFLGLEDHVEAAPEQGVVVGDYDSNAAAIRLVPRVIRHAGILLAVNCSRV